MGEYIKNTKRNRKILDNHFRLSTLQEKEFEPFTIGETYKNIKEQDKIITILLDLHYENQCKCMKNKKCLFKQYEEKSINIENCVRLYKKNV